MQILNFRGISKIYIFLEKKTSYLVNCVILEILKKSILFAFAAVHIAKVNFETCQVQRSKNNMASVNSFNFRPLTEEA